MRTTIFGLIDVFVGVHKQFLQKIKKSYDSYPKHNIEIVFLETLPALRIYSDYVKNYSVGIHAIKKEKETSIMFAEFVAVCNSLLKWIKPNFSTGS